MKENSIEYGGITKIIHSSLNTFKHQNIFEYINIPENYSLEQILKISCSCNIIEQKLLKTPIGTSFDGSHSTGFVLIINSLIRGKLDYISTHSKNSYSTHNFHLPFSTNISIPEFYVNSGSYKINTFVTDMYCQKVSSTKVMLNINILLEYFL